MKRNPTPARFLVRTASLFRSLVPLLPAAGIFCANQMRPSGGPVDTDPPRIVRSEPSDGSVGVPRRMKIALVFSEWIEPRSADKSVSVFPVPDDGYRVKTAGKTLEITCSGRLDDSTTYHVEIGASLQDLHGVSIGAPYHFVFSTGPRLDSAYVWGCVVAPGGTAQPTVALYRRDEHDTVDTALLSMPDYITQTDTLGRFSLKNLRKGTYDVLAFVDGDNNNRLSSGTEQAYAPLEKRLSLETGAGPITLFAATCDSSAQRIVSCVPLSSTLLECRWGTGARAADSSLTDASWAIAAVDTADTAAAVLPKVDSVIATGNPLHIVLSLDPPLRMTPYYLIYCPRPAMHLHDTAPPVRDTIRFNGTSLPDTTPPSCTGSLAAGTVSLEPRIALAWSEPVRAVVSGFVLADSLGDTVMLACDTVVGDTTELSLPRKLLPGRRYRCAVAESTFADLSGNLFIDTAATADSAGMEIRFGTVGEDKLCFSLSGSSPCLGSDPKRVWRFMPFGVKASYRCPDRNSSFRFDSIPSGKGVLGYFTDENGDGMPNPGSVFPWVPPEPSVLLPDTLEARARWDIEGIRVTDCSVCPDTTGAGSGPPVPSGGESGEKDSE